MHGGILHLGSTFFFIGRFHWWLVFKPQSPEILSREAFQKDVSGVRGTENIPSPNLQPIDFGITGIENQNGGSHRVPEKV